MLRSSFRRCLASSRSPLPHRSYASNALLLATNNASSSSPGTAPQPPPRFNNEDEDISDQEWELRTGMNMQNCRAMDILQQTLPHFFNTGLVATSYHLPLHMHGLLGASLVSLGSLAKGKSHTEDRRSESPGEEGIYSRSIRLEYTPPVALPAPFPRMLRAEGLPLYVASSIFVRHALHALYTDLAVAIRKVQIRSGPPNRSSIPSPDHPPPQTSTDRDTTKGSQRRQRERAITIGLLVSGTGRLGLSGERAEWDVTSTYTFSPRTGRVVLHTVNAIHPAPSETVYAAFHSALSTLGNGFSAPSNQKGAMNVARGQTPR